MPKENTVITGGGSADTFVFLPSQGTTTTIHNFNAAQKFDLGQFSNINGIGGITISERPSSASRRRLDESSPHVDTVIEFGSTLPGSSGEQQDQTGLIAGLASGGVALLMLGAIAGYRWLTRQNTRARQGDVEAQQITPANDNTVHGIRPGATSPSAMRQADGAIRQ